MDHTGGMYMAIAILLALLHRQRTGEGQWVDLACTEAGLTLNGPAILDWTVNGRPLRREGQPNGNRSEWPPMAPHGIYPARGDDEWVAIACRDDADWQALAGQIGADWAAAPALRALEGRLADQDRLDERVGEWTARRNRLETQRELQAAGLPCVAVQRPEERIERDPSTSEWGLWPEVHHTKMGDLRVDGLPVHFSKTDWEIGRGGPCLGEHTEHVLTSLLGLSAAEVAGLRDEGVV